MSDLKQIMNLPDSYHYAKESKLSVRAKAELLNQRVKNEVVFPAVPGLKHFSDATIRKEIDNILGPPETLND